MEIKRKYTITECNFPIDGIYTHNAQVWISVDGGNNYYYCGIGKFCKSEADAVDFCNSYENSHK